MTLPILAERVDGDTLIADCRVLGWWYLWSQCDHPRAFRSRHRRRYLVLRVVEEEP